MIRAIAARNRPFRRDFGSMLGALAVLVVLGGWLPAPHAVAREAASPSISLEQAARKVRRAHGGQVVSAGAARVQGRDGYRIRVLTKDGRVHTFWVDAHTGAMRPTR